MSLGLGEWICYKHEAAEGVSCWWKNNVVQDGRDKRKLNACALLCSGHVRQAFPVSG